MNELDQVRELVRVRKEAAAWKKAYEELLSWVKNPPHSVCSICGEHAFYDISKRCEDHPPR